MDPLRIKVVHLHLTSWSGISIGARHWYGTLYGIRKSHRLEAVIGEEEAKKRNRTAAAVYGISHATYKPRDMSEGFSSREAVIAFAVKTWRMHFRGYHLLVEGDRCYVEPKPVLDGDHPLRARINRMAKEFEKISGWEGNPKRADQLSDEWHALTRS